MDVITQAALSVKKEDRIYHFYCANNANLGELYDVLNEMRAYVLQRIKDSDEASKPKEEVPKEG